MTETDVFDSEILVPGFNTLETYDFSRIENLQTTFKNVVNEIMQNQLQSSLIILNNPETLFLESFCKLELMIPQQKGLCILDLNLFDAPLKQSTFHEETLVISFRIDQKCVISKNFIQIGFDLDEENYLLTDMHLTFIFERIVYKVLKDFDPCLVICLNDSEFTRNRVSDTFVFSGDGKNR